MREGDSLRYIRRPSTLVLSGGGVKICVGEEREVGASCLLWYSVSCCVSQRDTAVWPCLSRLQYAVIVHSCLAV